MKKHGRLGFSHILIFFVFGVFLTAGATTLPAETGTGKQIQVLEGFLEKGTHTLYVLNDLKKGDVVYANMENTSGNLDPLLGILKKGKEVWLTPEEILQLVVHSERNFIDSYAQFADEFFLAWDDDSGSGYAAKLEFLVPADGTYFIFVGSMLTNQTFSGLTPEFTSGSYRLLLGINAPEVDEGQGEATGEQFAVIDDPYGERPVYVQRVDLHLDRDKQLTFFHIKKMQPGDILYARLKSMDNAPLPRLYLSDFGGKPLAFGSTDEQSMGVALSYRTQEDGGGMRLYVDGTTLDAIPETAEYRLDVGVNVPEVTGGAAVASGLPVFEESQNVQIGLVVDQIANVDQQSENFSVVGSLEIIWQEPKLAFSPDKCNCVIKKMGLNDLKAYASKHDILLPFFTFFNQQGKRWSQGELVFVEPSGRTTYIERFTVTLQAPDFDFRAYPFDSQRFNIRIDLSVPTEIFKFEGIEQPDKALGDFLGEEEWSVIYYEQKVETIPFTKNFEKSRFTMTMEVKRHLNFYTYRIIIPLLLIITVSWVIFFLKDYGRQLEVASGNLLVFVAFNFTISNDLPRLGYLTLLDRVIINSFCCAALVVFISVCQKRLEAKGRKELASKIDYIVLITYPLVYVFLAIYEYVSVVVRL